MPTYDREQREAVDRLVEDYTRHGLSRRQFMQRALAAGLSISAAGALLAACGNSSSAGGNVSSVSLVTTWGGEEQASFKAVVAPWTQKTGIQVKIEATRDLDALLTTRIRGKNPPDLAILPNPGKMQQLVQQRALIPIDQYLDMNKLKQDYTQSWIDLGTVNGKLYAIFYKAANKGTVWYSPSQFQSNNYTIPATFDDMLNLSNQIVSGGKFPWSMGVESGAASGWPAADWVAQIYLEQNGPDMYDKWVAHQIPWTDASIRTAMDTFGKIAHGKNYIQGAPQSILATGFQDATYAPFKTPPTAYMYYLGDFAAGFITTQFPKLQPGTGFDFFAFPSFNPTYAGAVTGGADVVVALKDNNGVKQLIQYLETADAQAIWVKRGGFTSPNKNVPISDYPNAVAKKSAQQLVAAPTFRYGAGDLMPPQVQQKWWQGMLSYIGDASQLDNVLNDIENTAKSAYK